MKSARGGWPQTNQQEASKIKQESKRGWKDNKGPITTTTTRAADIGREEDEGGEIKF